MTRQELQEIFESPFNWENWRKVMDFVFPEFQYALHQEEVALDTALRQKYAQYIKQHGNTELTDGEKLVLYEVSLTEKVRLDRNVKSVRKLISGEVFTGYQIGLGVFHSEDKSKWRFTLVIREFTPALTVTDKKPESYTYVFGGGERGRTAAERFYDLSKIEYKKLKDLEEAFSVEKLSKKFFTQYKEVYLEFVDNIKDYPSRLSLFKAGTKDEQEKLARDFIKKMMGRIVLLYFLQKKGWMGCKSKWQEGEDRFMQKLFEAAPQDSSFYMTYLEHLFFYTLNAKREESDEECEISGKNFGKVPFLNGGLFEREDSHPDNLTLDWEIFNRFFETLNNYNFTIIEDDPDFKEIAVDPEMLGHIFENLLEDNKDKGAFYTPKEIVQYMCQESLIEYLNTQLGKNIEHEALKDAIRDFVVKQDFVALNDISQRADQYVLQALRDIKVCDPAIGSGAFPMGILHEIYRMVDYLQEDRDIFLDIWNKEVWDAARVKEDIIQNSIYGVDIEKGAVDIARLRFWLSIIIEEEEPNPLPNLDYKIVVGNSLLNKFEDHVIDIEWEVQEGAQTNTKTQEFLERRSRLLEEISEKQKTYFDTESANRVSLSQEIKDLKIDILINQLEMKIADEGTENEPKLENFTRKAAFVKAQKLYFQTLEWKEVIDELEAIKGTDKPFNHFDWKLDFPEILNPIINKDITTFDVVIGNPPYGIWISEEEKRLFKEEYPLASYKINLYILFMERTLKLFDNSFINYIIPKSILNNSFFAPIREYLLKNCSIKQIYLIGEKVFEDAEVGGSLILSLSSIEPTQGHELEVFKSVDFESDSSKINFNVISQSEFLKIPGYEISATSNENFNLIVKLAQLSKVVDQYDLKNGLNPGNIKSKLISKTNESALHRKIIWGKDLNKFEVKWSGDYVLYDPDISVSLDDLQSKEGMKKQTKPDFALRDISLFETSKIMVRKTGDKIIASIDEEENLYFDTLVHGIYQKDPNYTLSFLLSVLNSNVATWIYRLLHDVKGKVFAKISLINLKNFPLPNSDKANRDYLGDLCLQMLEYKAEGKETVNLERKIDISIAKLYDLAFDEILSINEDGFGLSEEEYNNLSTEDMVV